MFRLLCIVKEALAVAGHFVWSCGRVVVWSCGSEAPRQRTLYAQIYAQLRCDATIAVAHTYTYMWRLKSAEVAKLWWSTAGKQATTGAPWRRVETNRQR